MFHLVLGDGLPLALVLLEDVVPDDRHLVGEAEREVAARAGRDRGADSLGHREHRQCRVCLWVHREQGRLCNKAPSVR